MRTAHQSALQSVLPSGSADTVSEHPIGSIAYGKPTASAWLIELNQSDWLKLLNGTLPPKRESLASGLLRNPYRPTLKRIALEDWHRQFRCRLNQQYSLAVSGNIAMRIIIGICTFQRVPFRRATVVP